MGSSLRVHTPLITAGLLLAISLAWS